jgi:hypothetical protein
VLKVRIVAWAHDDRLAGLFGGKAEGDQGRVKQTGYRHYDRKQGRDSGGGEQHVAEAPDPDLLTQ